MIRTCLATLATAALAQMASLPVCAHPAQLPAADAQGALGTWRVHAPSRTLAERAAISLHDQLIEIDQAAGTLVAQLTDAQVADLRQRGFRLERDTAVEARQQRLQERMEAAGLTTLLGREGQRQRALAGEAAEGIPSYPCYETVEETQAEAAALASAHPSLASWQPIGESWTKTQGSGGYDLMVLKLTDTQTPPPGPQGKPVVLIDASIHGREYATAPLLLAFARELLAGWRSDADATWMLMHHEVHLVFHVNPDGRKKAEGGLLWRKNTNPAGCAGQPTQFGVDLNRNFAYTWNMAAGGSSGYACAETYRGPSPASEPETQAMEAYMRQIWPDQRGPGQSDPAPANTQGLYLTIHSNAAMILWPWGEVAAPTGNGTALTTMGRKLAHFNGYLPTQAIGLYPTDGSSRSAAYGELGVASFTLELGGSNFFLACSAYENTIKPANLPMLRYAVRVARAPYLLPAGPDVSAVALSGKAATSGVRAGNVVTLSATAVDGGYSTRNGTEPVQPVASAQVFVGLAPWQSGAVAIAASAADGSFNTASEGLTAALDTTGMAPGRYLVYVQAVDALGNTGPVSATSLKIKR